MFTYNDTEMKFCSWELYFENTYLANLNTERSTEEKFQNQ